MTASSHISSSGNLYANNVGPIYDDKIYLTPTDFDHLTDKGSILIAGEIEDNGGNIRDNGARAGFHAQKIIPKGFTATGVRVNTSTTNTNLVNAWSGSVAEVVNTGLGSLLFTNNVSQSSNADASFNYPVIGDGENYVTVQCMTSGSGVIGGGKIYISRT